MFRLKDVTIECAKCRRKKTFTDSHRQVKPFSVKNFTTSTMGL